MAVVFLLFWKLAATKLVILLYSLHNAWRKTERVPAIYEYYMNLNGAQKWRQIETGNRFNLMNISSIVYETRDFLNAQCTHIVGVMYTYMRVHLRINVYMSPCVSVVYSACSYLLASQASSSHDWLSTGRLCHQHCDRVANSIILLLLLLLWYESGNDNGLRRPLSKLLPHISSHRTTTATATTSAAAATVAGVSLLWRYDAFIIIP